MALTLRDDLHGREAAAYVSLAEVGAFASARGEDAWAEAPEQRREAAVVRATDYLDARYTFAAGAVGIPAAVRWASAFLAIQALKGALFIDPTGGVDGVAAASGPVVSKTERVGPLSETTTYASPSGASAGVADTDGQWRVFPIVEGWLKPLLASGGSGSGVTRVVRT